MLEIKNVYKTFNPGTINEKKALNGLLATAPAALVAGNHRAHLFGTQAAQLREIILRKDADNAI